MKSNTQSWKTIKSIKKTEYTITDLKPSSGYYIYVKKYAKSGASAPIQATQPFYTLGM